MTLKYECENMSAFGCSARDFAKELMLQEMIEGSDTYTELAEICKEQCCYGCDKHCGYRCNKSIGLAKMEVENNE